MSFDENQQDAGAFSQEVHFRPNTARVPEKVHGGVCATGAIVLNGPHEFMVDFFQRLSSPQQLVTRVIIPATLMPAFIQALADNIANFTSRFGPPPSLPTPPPGTPVPPIEEVYAQMKISDDTLCGVYCNTVMIAHSPAEFCFDFITSGFPRSVVCARVLMAAPHAPRVLDSLKRSYDQFQQRRSNPPAPEP
jgi:hypothetical protein